MASNIRVGFSTDPKSWVSRIIRWFTKSKCSHAFLLADDATLGTIIIQSDAGGVQVRDWKKFNVPGNTIVHTFVPKMDLEPALRQAIDLLGAGYDYSGLIGMSWVELMWHLFKKKVHNPLHDKHALFCSAFVLTVLQIAGWPGADKLAPADTDAQMLWDFLDANPA